MLDDGPAPIYNGRTLLIAEEAGLWECLMISGGYNDLLEQVSQLASQGKINLLADLAAMVRASWRPRKRHNIMEFEGMGTGLWKDIDVDAYLNQERDSWNG